MNGSGFSNALGFVPSALGLVPVDRGLVLVERRFFVEVFFLRGFCAEDSLTTGFWVDWRGEFFFRGQSRFGNPRFCEGRTTLLISP